MVTIKDKLWNWGHLEGSHNKCTGLNCFMTPEEYAKEYGVRNAFMVSYGGNIQPPYSELAKRFTELKEIKWSVLGDASTPLPEAELGNTLDVCEVARTQDNITGGVVDDFFSEKRVKRFTPEVLKKMKDTLNNDGLDFWCVLYKNNLDMDIDKHLECFDGVTFWIWEPADISNMDEILEKVYARVRGKRLMLGVYMWDYAGAKEMPTELFQRQLDKYFGLLRENTIEGIIFCSSTLGDADIETNKILKEYIRLYGDEEIEE